MSKKIKVLSLFDGISCAQVALKSLGYDVEYYASEIDKYALEVTRKNHPETIQLGDIKNIDGKKFNVLFKRKVDLLIGGSPCQDLSISKQNREGLKGKRSGLFYEYLRILKEAKPKYFVLENVASMPKEAKDEISKQLGVEPIMINAALVSAQQRKRLFWTNIKNVELPEDREIFLRDIIHEFRGETVDEKYFVSDKALKNKKTVIKGMNEKARALSANMRGVGNNGTTCIRIGKIGNGGQGERIYSIDGKSIALSANGGGCGAKTGLYKIKNYVRKLTPIECERLQSLLEDSTKTGIDEDGKKIKMSNTQRYKMCGNAFNRLVIENILKNI